MAENFVRTFNSPVRSTRLGRGKVRTENSRLRSLGHEFLTPFAVHHTRSNNHACDEYFHLTTSV